MKLRSPRHRYNDLFHKKRAPVDESERALFVLLHGADELNKLLPHKPWDEGTPIDVTIKYPHQIFQIEETRAVLESFLLATEEDDKIADAVAMEPEEVGKYRSLFFDTSVFHSDLELIVYIRSIEDDHPYKDLYKVAFHQGFKALRWQFCRDQNKGHISPEEVLRIQMLDSHFRAMEHRGKTINGKITKEAQQYGKFAVSCARMIQQFQAEGGSEEDNKDLRFRFASAEQNKTVDELSDKGIRILH